MHAMHVRCCQSHGNWLDATSGCILQCHPGTAAELCAHLAFCSGVLHCCTQALGPCGTSATTDMPAGQVTQLLLPGGSATLPAGHCDGLPSSHWPVLSGMLPPAHCLLPAGIAGATAAWQVAGLVAGGGGGRVGHGAEASTAAVLSGGSCGVRTWHQASSWPAAGTF